MFGLELTIPLLGLIVFLVNVIPAFMPPTWIVLAYFYITKGGDPLMLAVFGALFSTLGRLVLAKWSGPLVSRLLTKPMKKNVEFAHEKFSEKPFASFFFTFFYALSPFPSNAIFMIAGTAKIRLIPIVFGFFIGRVISYFVLLYLSLFAVGVVNSSLSFEDPLVWAIDLLGIALTIAFFMIDWTKFLGKKDAKK